MTIKRNIILISLLFIFTLSIAQAELKNCEYVDTKVLVVPGGSDTSCKPAKFCFAEIECEHHSTTRKVKNDDAPLVTRSIVCSLDSKGDCPDKVDVCREDTTASFEKEASIGSMGEQDWAATVSKIMPEIAYLYFKLKLNELPPEGISVQTPPGAPETEKGSR